MRLSDYISSHKGIEPVFPIVSCLTLGSLEPERQLLILKKTKIETRDMQLLLEYYPSNQTMQGTIGEFFFWHKSSILPQCGGGRVGGKLIELYFVPKWTPNGMQIHTLARRGVTVSTYLSVCITCLNASLSLRLYYLSECLSLSVCVYVFLTFSLSLSISLFLYI